MRISTRRNRNAGAALLLIGVMLFTGCTSSRWKFIRQRPQGKAVTKVTVITEPAGAEIAVNGNYQAKSPVEIPVRYPYIVRVYERREVLPYPHLEEREVPVYSGNVFRFEANLLGYKSASRSVSFNGEEKKEVVFRLEKRID